MTEDKMTHKSDILRLFGAKTVLPRESAEEYAAVLTALVAKLHSKNCAFVAGVAG